MNSLPAPPEMDAHQRILSLAALFDGEFSIDWLQELSGDKPLLILEALDLDNKKKWLQSERPGFYIFIDPQRQIDLKTFLPAEKMEGFLCKITEILLNEAPEGPEKNRILAKSLLKIDNDVIGCRRLLAEGTIMRKQYRLHEALGYYNKAIEDLGRLKGKEADRLLLEATIEYSKVSMTETDSTLAVSTIRKALKRAKARDLIPYRALLKMHLAKHEWLRSDLESAMINFEEGSALAGEIDDERFQRSIHLLSAFFAFWLGRFREALNYYEKFAPEIDHIPRVGFPLLVRPVPGACLVFCGAISQGLGMVRTAINNARKSNNTFVTCYAESSMACIYNEIGRFNEALEFFESSLEKTENGRHFYIRLGNFLGIAYANLKLGKTERAVAALQQFQELNRHAQIYFSEFPAIMDLCWSMEQGELPLLDGFCLKQEISNSMRNPNVFVKGMGYRYKALIKKRAGELSREVIREYNNALEWLEISGNKISIAKIKLELAVEYLEMGDEEHARTVAGPPISFLLTVNRNLIPKELLYLEKEMQSNQDMLKDIFRLSQELVTIRDNRELAGRIISTANRFTGAERGAIFLVEKDSERVVLRASKNLTPEDVASPGFAPSMKIIAETIHASEGRVIEFESPAEKDSSAGDFVCSCICVPMILKNDSFGVLYHDNLVFRSAFKESDMEMLDYFAALAAIAIDNAQVYTALEEMVEKQEEQKQYYKEQYLEVKSFENIVGKSPAIKKVFHHIESVAETDATVLILGETGVGKELVARAIHRNSPRKANPFIRVNCSAFSENLISSELFGHEKGSFTGAFKRSAGRFELADGGTLFLDEIGDIPPEVQVRLLRVLQSGEFERVGGNETLKSDFRLLAATNRDLEKEVQSGQFRQDLYFRLNVFPIHVPPLRDRKEDISLLAYHFLNIISKKLGKTIETISKNDLEKFMAYNWPGNIRELENIIERGVILSSGANLQIPDSGFKAPDKRVYSVGVTHEENERTHILRVLQKTAGKVAGTDGAAEILNIHPNTLRYRMKKLGIKKSDHMFITNPVHRN